MGAQVGISEARAEVAPTVGVRVARAEVAPTVGVRVAPVGMVATEMREEMV